MNSPSIARASRRTLLGLACAALLPACALTHPTPSIELYDFGTALAPADAHPGAAIGIARLASVAWLQSPAIRYRLPYAEPNELHAYATSRWSMPPPELLDERLRERLGADFEVMDGEAGPHSALLRIDLDEFTHVFHSPTESVGLVQFRASLSRDGAVLGQRTFTAERPAASADAAGGVMALKDATDASIQELDGWIKSILR